MAVHAFLSFQEEDMDRVWLFRGQARNKNSDLEFSDYSVRETIGSERAEYVKRIIRAKIRRCPVVMCLIGRATHTSSWAGWEPETAYKMGKCPIGVRLNRDRRDKVPTALEATGAEMVDWRIGDIMDAIDAC